MTIDELAARMDERFAGIDSKIDAQFAAVDAKMDARFATVDAKMEQGFNASRVRDESIEVLIATEGEAREVLRDEIHRRFVSADRKHDEQITLLKDAVQHLSSRK